MLPAKSLKLTGSMARRCGRSRRRPATRRRRCISISTRRRRSTRRFSSNSLPDSGRTVGRRDPACKDPRRPAPRGRDGVLSATTRTIPRDLDLGFYLFRGGMKPHGLGKARDDVLNAALEQALRPIADAAEALGARREDARLLMVGHLRARLRPAAAGPYGPDTHVWGFSACADGAVRKKDSRRTRQETQGLTDVSPCRTVPSVRPWRGRAPCGAPPAGCCRRD